jgi:hypothetical protein
MVFISLFYIFIAHGANPTFTEAEINKFSQEVKTQKKMPDKAVDIIFDFYKKNRKSVGGLKDSSCVDKKEYKVRTKDIHFKKSYLKTGIENENCLCVIDYTASKIKKRGHCIFLEPGKAPLIENFLVAHGSGSGEKDGVPLKFTNRTSSTGTTLSGLHITSTDLYGFNGSAKGSGKYTSPGLTLYGVEESNWTAAEVGKVTHGAPYVSDSPVHVGRSHGCPAMTLANAKKFLPMCKGKAAWLHYTVETANKVGISPRSCD